MKTIAEKGNLKPLLKEQGCFQKLSSYSIIPFVFIIKFYRKFISPAFPASCRFTPTCSQYSLEALQKYGLIKGLFLSVKRILKCNPLFHGGHDPIP